MNVYLDKMMSLLTDCKYSRIYYAIIDRSLSRPRTKSKAKEKFGYVEAHHILPKSFKLGGEKDKENIVFLTAKEHLVCHLVLCRCTHGKFLKSMKAALVYFNGISKRNQQIKLTSWEYEAIKKYNAELASARKSFLNKKHKAASIEKMRMNANGFKQGCVPWNKGKKESEDHKKARVEGRLRYQSLNPNWADQCRRALKSGESARLEAICKRTKVNDKIYSSAAEAARCLGLKKTTLIKRVLSPNFLEYSYVGIDINKQDGVN